ncbi:MAG: AMP-binding protein [Candidatus Gastranaerophilales bacterium]|nr:AMP-binding protein [Candidatus Gastranaerophilales bacterium]
MKNVNLLSFLDQRTKEMENNVALGTRTNLGWAELTYKGLSILSRKVGSYLISYGLNKGDKAAILSESMPEFGAAIFGCVLAGLTIVPLDIKLTIHEYEHILSDCLPKVILSSEAYLETAKKIKELIPSIEQIIVIDGKKPEAEYPNLYAIETTEQKWRHKRLDETAIICYTSGTTGNPKGVEITYRNMLSQVISIGQRFHLGPNDSMLSFLPMNHLYEISVGFMSSLNKGASIYYSHSLKPKDILSVMQSKKIAFMATVPSFLKLLKSTLEAEIKQYGPFKSRFYKLKYTIAYALNNPYVSKLFFREIRRKFGPRFKGFMSGGAPLEHEVGRFFETIGVNIYEAYGLSEASPVVSMNYKHNRRLGSVGKALPGVKVRTDAKTQELQVKGDNVMKGYYNKPEMTKSVMTEDGWLKTGDIAKISKQGFIYITGRIKNMIVLSGGKKVFPEEVEAVLTKSNLVEECIVYSELKKSGAKQGTEEIVAKIYPGKANVEKYDGEELRNLVKAEVKKLSLELSQYKRPTNIDVTFEPLPRTGISKISRKAIVGASK